ncbi:MAG: hypothetical protein IJI38_03405 [Clostridia bacterium]|nr:hypothetical protein [Clostridia bacterium]
MNLTEQALFLARTLGGKNQLNCIAEIDPTAADQAGFLERNASSLPLSGIPVLIKDNMDVSGLHTTAGSAALRDNLASQDAPVVRNLRRSGAVILGKTNMTEFANFTTYGMPGGYSSLGGQVIHAVNPEVNPSGSSSGSAVAVSAGIVPMAVGTDTSFSIIHCAMANGICGLKPPVGTLSAEGIIPIAPTLDSAGPMAANFSDALRLYSAMRDTPLPALSPARPERLRLAVNTAGSEKMPGDYTALIHRFLDRMCSLGAQVTEIDQPSAPEMMTIMKWEFKPYLEAYLAASSSRLKTLKDIVDEYESHPETMMRYGDALLRASLDETPGGLNGEPYLTAMKTREETIPRIHHELEGFDAVIMTGPTTIPHFCGLPSATVAGKLKLKNGVRHALMLYGSDEYRLLETALTIESELGQLAEAP